MARWEAEAVAAAMRGRLGKPVVVFEAIGSTNDEAKRLAEAGAAEGTLVLAETQTAGRGRGGRRWLSPPGTGLALSLVLRPRLAAAQAARLTMLAGVAGAEAIEAATGARAALKWPNDILLGGRKAGGILVECGLAGERLEYAVTGVGLNVSAAPPAEAVEVPAAAVAEAAGRPVDRLELLTALVGALERWYARVGDGAALREAWARRLAWLGEQVTAHTAEGELAGVAEGVDEDGALLLRLASGERRRLWAADVRLRPGHRDATGEEMSDVR
ncbi:MAG: biotin--[acetyl-CoA-carboxylase] ligase [Anaerolineales bacterium]|nr:biotin--[acetyl-CoA-carboxylase] ligase [Anaerolineales bacterium]